MPVTRTLAKASRNWVLVAAAGAAGFIIGVIAFLAVGTASIIAFLADAPAPLAAAIVALMYAGGQYLESYAERAARREMTALLSRCRAPPCGTGTAGSRRSRSI